MRRFLKYVPWFLILLLWCGAVYSFSQDWSWVIPLVVAATAIIGIFGSKPENKELAWITTCLLLIVGGWDAYSRHSDDRTKAELRRRVYQNLTREVASFAEHLSDLVVRSSDGWLPKTETELFSERVAQMICTELDVTKDAPVVPKRTLLEWAAENNKAFRTSIEKALAEGGAMLDADLVRILSKVERGHYWGTPEGTIRTWNIDRRFNVSRPPLMCWGLEPLVKETLSDTLDLLVHVRSQRRSLALDWPEEYWLKFPEPFRNKFLGSARFSPEALNTWRAAHPGAPGPALYGSGPPEKQ